MNPWRSELPLAFLAFLFTLFVGQLLHAPVLALWMGLLAYLCYHLLQLQRLLKWLESGKSGSLPGALGVWDDIYHLILRLRRSNKRRKKKLIRMLERFRTATAALPDATVVLNPENEIDWFNDAAGKLLGLRRNDIGQKIDNLIRTPKFVDYLLHANYQTTVSIPSPLTGNILIEIRIVPYADDLRLLVAQNVTQLRFMERVRSDFVANVSHELRTPLTVIRGYMETLNDHADHFPEPYGRMLQRIEEQTLRMQHLIDDLLSLTRLETESGQGLRQVVDVPELLRDIFEEARIRPVESKPDVQLSLECQDGLYGAESELRSAFSNLIVNAIKYCGEGDSVRVRWSREGDVVRLDVEDTGPGISPEHLPRLTERFYRVDSARGAEGFGLGLAIVKHVLARHDAALEIKSTPGKGSRFSCRFPASRRAPPGQTAS